MVGLNLDKNYGIILLGAIAKFIFFLYKVIYMSIRHTFLNLVMIIIVDLIFTLFYIEFLLNYK